MPEEGRTGISMPLEVFDKFESLFKKNIEKWRGMNITSPSQLMIWCALQKYEEIFKLEVKKQS